MEADTASESTDFLTSAFLLGNVGAPFLIGVAVGFFAKKMLKLTLLLGGAAIVLMFVGEYFGVISISNEGLESAANSASDLAAQSGSFLMDRLSTFTTRGMSATAGFLLGLKMG